MDIIEKNKPFILTKSNKITLLPRDYQNFNESAESYIRFVQGANTFVTVNNQIKQFDFIKHYYTNYIGQGKIFKY